LQLLAGISEPHNQRVLRRRNFVSGSLPNRPDAWRYDDQKSPSRGLFVFSQLLTAGCTYSGLPSRARIRREHFNLSTILWIDWIVERSISLVRGAWRKAYVVVGTAIYPSIIELIKYPL
jgi:hypothetical protein